MPGCLNLFPCKVQSSTHQSPRYRWFGLAAEELVLSEFAESNEEPPVIPSGASSKKLPNKTNHKLCSFFQKTIA